MAILAGKNEPSDSCGYPTVSRNKAHFEAQGFEVDDALVPDSEHEIKPWAMKALAAFTRHYAHKPRPKPARTPRMKAPGG